MKTRREFLRSWRNVAMAGGAAGFTRLGRMSAMAQSSSTYRALVCVFLFGGNDNNNTIVPMSAYSDYQNSRRSLAIPQGSLLPVNASGGRVFGLHPRLTGLGALYNQGRAAAVLNVGMLVRPITKADLRTPGSTPTQLYSHSDQTAQWQAANPMGPAGTGWGGRAADIVQFANSGGISPSVSVNGNPLQLTGQLTRPLGMSPGARFGLDSLGNTAFNNLRDGAMTQLLTFDTGATLVAAASGIQSAGLRNASAINAALEAATPVATPFPNTSLGRQLAQVARVVKVRAGLGMNRQIFFCGMGGFDNHSNLLPDHDNLLRQVDAAMSAFDQATVELGVQNDVTAFTESEFGRTLDGDPTVGSDHAWGGNHLVVGGAVRGAEAYGRMPTLRLGGARTMRATAVSSFPRFRLTSRRHARAVVWRSRVGFAGGVPQHRQLPHAHPHLPVEAKGLGRRAAMAEYSDGRDPVRSTGVEFRTGTRRTRSCREKAGVRRPASGGIDPAV